MRSTSAAPVRGEYRGGQYGRAVARNRTGTQLETDSTTAFADLGRFSYDGDTDCIS